MAVTQTPISARIKHEVLWAMNQEAMLGYHNKNEIVNEGASLFLDLLDTRRSMRAMESGEAKAKLVRGWLMKWFPEALDEQSWTRSGNTR